ncbi:MAG: hypothetical protein ER33_13930 [Cyanobium sp. CACIAM 14]|nr:MAG: hypothetical protein ER33_13930 [Cyanobium sp. CACIAM 14]
MKLLNSLRVRTASAGTICATVLGATVLGGPLVALPAARALPISGVAPASATRVDGGPRRPGAIQASTGGSRGTSVAKGRPMVFPAPAGLTPDSPADELVGMKR